MDDGELQRLLRDAVVAVIKLAEAKGLGSKLPVYEYTVVWNEKVGPGRWEGREGTRTTPYFQGLSEALEPELSSDERIQALLSAAVQFVQDHGTAPVGVLQDPKELASRLLPVYFREVSSLTVDDTAITETARQYVEDLKAQNAVIETVFQVSNFSAAEPFSLTEEIRFRPITTEDIDALGTAYPSLFMQPQRPLQTDDWICEVNRSGPKVSWDEFNRHYELADLIVGALSLTCEGRAMLRLRANRFKSPFFRGGTVAGGEAIATTRSGGPIHLELDNIESFKSNFRSLEALNSDSATKHLRLPFRRLRSASARTEVEDQLVDIVIGLERLLASDSPQLETTFRFRLRGAALLPDSFGDSAAEPVNANETLLGIN